MASPERYRVYAMLNFVGTPPDPAAGLCAGLERPRRGPAEGRVRAMGRLGHERALSVRRSQASRLSRISPNYKGAMRALCLSDDPWATRPAVELLCSGFTLDQAGNPDHHAGRRGRRQDRPFRLLPPRASRHAVARCGGMDRGGGVGSPSSVVPALKPGPRTTGRSSARGWSDSPALRTERRWFWVPAQGRDDRPVCCSIQFQTADRELCKFAISRRDAPEVLIISRPLIRGRRECRVPDAPAALCAKW